MSADIMPCGCEGHADNEGLCAYPALREVCHTLEARVAGLDSMLESQARVVARYQARVAELEGALSLAMRSVEMVQRFEFAVDRLEQRLSLYAQEALEAAEKLGVESAKSWTYEECDDRIRAALSKPGGVG